MPFEAYERELLTKIAAASMMAGMTLLMAWGVLGGGDTIALTAGVLLCGGGIIEWASGWETAGSNDE